MIEIRNLLRTSESPNQFFRRYFEAKGQESKEFSLRKISKAMGYSNPSFVSDVLRERRRANVELVFKFKKLEPLSALEETYIQNLIVIDSGNDPALCDAKRVENKFIAEYWNYKMVPAQSGSGAIDVLISGPLRDKKEFTLSDIIGLFNNMIDSYEITARVDRQLVSGALSIDERGVLSQTDSPLKIHSQSALLEMLPILEKMITRTDEKRRQQNVMSLLLTEASMKKAIDILRHACEQIAILAMEDEKREEPDERLLFALYTAIFKV